MTGKIFIVATPIGNLEDISFRAIRILKESDIIYAEDTRVTSKLLDHYEIKNQVKSYHQHSILAKREEILQNLISGKSISLVTDAGTPGISDPGNELIDFILTVLPPDTVVPIPGASSLTAALSVSGFNVNKFVFLGFMPKKKRTKLFNWIKDGGLSFAFLESPYRLLKTLKDLESQFLGTTRVMVARELTKLHETLYRGSLEEVVGILENEKIKGEVVVIVEGT